MEKNESVGLLPVGITDVLYPKAKYQADLVQTIIYFFSSYGYELVDPALAEYEESLLVRKHNDLAKQTFRIIDPYSSKMIGIRADITPQISRLAVTRLKNEPRPLRLCYAGKVLRYLGENLYQQRQFFQVGAEIIGEDSAKADSEVMLLALQIFKDIGIKGLSIDLNLPTIFPLMCKQFNFDEEEQKKLIKFINQKDFSKTDACLLEFGERGRKARPFFQQLFDAYGDYERVLCILKGLNINDEAVAEFHRLRDVCALLKNNMPDLSINVDALECNVFEYYRGIVFSIYSQVNQVELAKGGRYIASLPGSRIDPAVGVTLVMENLLKIINKNDNSKRLYVPKEVGFEETIQLRKQGYTVVCGFSENIKEEACRLACQFIYENGNVIPCH
ncbi:MAG: ATP phosphoribosyltransferase regulatory subunit [Alphaproteobacteria bacterium]|nr:ATP phosphoribosyltransferase regulatory subunit [Alphaproteobacteria bacterium]